MKITHLIARPETDDAPKFIEVCSEKTPLPILARIYCDGLVEFTEPNQYSSAELELIRSVTDNFNVIYNSLIVQP